MSVNRTLPSAIMLRTDHERLMAEAAAGYHAELRYRAQLSFQNGAIVFGIIGLIGGILLTSWAIFQMVSQ
jgi:hypothetical protein